MAMRKREDRSNLSCHVRDLSVGVEEFRSSRAFRSAASRLSCSWSNRRATWCAPVIRRNSHILCSRFLLFTAFVLSFFILMRVVTFMLSTAQESALESGSEINSPSWIAIGWNPVYTNGDRSIYLDEQKRRARYIFSVLFQRRAMLPLLRDVPDRENLRGRLAQAGSLNRADRAHFPRAATLSCLISAISLFPQSPIFSQKHEI